MNNRTTRIHGKDLSLSNLEKDLYPSYGFTKAKILEYYSRMAPVILPHLKDRALTLKRYPNGVEQEYFYEKRCPAHRPPWVRTAEVPYGDHKQLTACLIDNLEALIWVQNLASIELHVPLAKVESPQTPDSVVFDLDPGERADVLNCAKVALILRNLLDGLKLASYVKTSGKKGLHVFVPLNSPRITFVHTKSFSKAVAETMQKSYPELVTARMAKDSRAGKVFINWSQNDASKTMVSAYSLRAREMPAVSFPVAWKEIVSAVKQQDSRALLITHSQAVARAEKNGDLFAEMLTKKQSLPNP